MPLFGLLPYNDEEERKRRMLPPPTDLMGELEAARRPPVLPDVGMGRLGMVSAGNPAALPPPSINRQSRGGEIQEARDAYLERTPGRGRSALTGALQGFLGGGGLAGAIMGGASGATDPRGLREQEFNRKIRPRIEERFGFEDQERALVRQTEQDALNNAYKTAQIGELESQAFKNRLPPPAPRPINTPGGALDLETRSIIPGTAPLPQQPRESTPDFQFDVDRMPYNLRNPEERKRFESLPRSKRVKPEKTGGAAKPKKEQKFVPLSKIREYAKQKGISRDAAEAEARADGYTVIR